MSCCMAPSKGPHFKPACMQAGQGLVDSLERGTYHGCEKTGGCWL